MMHFFEIQRWQGWTPLSCQKAFCKISDTHQTVGATKLRPPCLSIRYHADDRMSHDNRAPTKRPTVAELPHSQLG